jgi:hypothetical protein
LNAHGTVKSLAIEGPGVIAGGETRKLRSDATVIALPIVPITTLRVLGSCRYYRDGRENIAVRRTDLVSNAETMT